MRESLRFLVSLSAVATLWSAGASLANAQESNPTQNTPGMGPAPIAPPAPTPGMEPASPGELASPSYTTTTETPAFTISDPNEPVIDATTTRTRRPNLPMLGTGSLLFVGSYVPTIIWQGAKDRNDNLFIPIAGPWMALSQGQHSTAQKTMYSLSGVAQALGALGIVGSFFVPERRKRHWNLMGMHKGKHGRSFAVEPQVSAYSYGLGAHGRF
jgi:hypothetical protein